MSENDFSVRIRELRTKHKLTLEQVAQQVGVGRSTVRKWETGMIENLRRDKIAKLATALHTTPAYLMGWDDSDVGPNPHLLSEQSGYWDGDRLSEERISRGYSISQISSLLGISEEEYDRLESGMAEPTFALLLLMADVFTCDLDYICHRAAKVENPTCQFSGTENLLIKKYRSLEEDGQAAVWNTLNFEYNRLPGEKANPAPKEA